MNDIEVTLSPPYVVSDAEIEKKYGGEGSGHWGHEGRPGEVGGSVPEGEGDGKSDLENSVRRMSGLRYTPADKLPKQIRDELHIEYVKELTPNNKIALGAVNTAISDLKGDSKQLNDFREVVRDNLQMSICSYEPKGAAMTMVTGKGQAIMLINTAFSLDDLDSFAAEKAGSYSMIAAADVLKNGGTREQAIKELYRISTYHELGHLFDTMTGNKFTELVVDSIIITQGSDMKKVGAYINKNISPYATNSPHDTAAEVFSMVLNGKKLPKDLAHIKDFIYGH